MFNEFVHWVSGRKGDRDADRKKVQFAVTWTRGTESIPGVGTEIALAGLTFATKIAPAAPAFNAILELAGRHIKARLTVKRTETSNREGTQWTLLACTFEGIAADDYDAIVRFIRDLPEPENKAHGEIAAAAAAGDDAYRLLPMNVQKRIVEVLVQHGRLARETDPRNPLLRMKHLSSKAGRHRFAVHSRAPVNDDIAAFDSEFTVEDSGVITLDR